MAMTLKELREHKRKIELDIENMERGISFEGKIWLQ
jgi:hypothetical protein